MSVDDADKQHANPNYGKERGYGINCQTCSPAYALRLMGFNVNGEVEHSGHKAGISEPGQPAVGTVAKSRRNAGEAYQHQRLDGR